MSKKKLEFKSDKEMQEYFQKKHQESIDAAKASNQGDKNKDGKLNYPELIGLAEKHGAEFSKRPKKAQVIKWLNENTDLSV